MHKSLQDLLNTKRAALLIRKNNKVDAKSADNRQHDNQHCHEEKEDNKSCKGSRADIEAAGTTSEERYPDSRT